MTRARRPRTGHRAVVAAVTAVLVVLQVSAVDAAGDPYRPQQWFLDRIGAPAAWEVTQGGQEVVAVVDSGVDLDHPDLRDRFVRDRDGEVVGRDFVDDDDVPRDGHGHGTMVAGIAMSTRNNDQGGVGVAPRARLLPVRVLDEDGRGNEADVEAGIRWAVDQGATVINLSLESAVQGGLQVGSGVSAPVGAVQYAWERGVVVVAAAGNSGSAFTDYPSNSPVLLVGSTDRDDGRAEFSDNGRRDIVMAPGVDIVSTWCREDGQERCTRGTHTYGQASGTSFSAPQVTAAVALLRSLGLDHEQAVDRVRSTARDLGTEGPDAQTGVGLLDLATAVETSRAAGATPAPEGDASPTTSPEPAPDVPTATAAPTPPATSDDPTPDPSPTGESEPAPSVTVIPNEDPVAAPPPGGPLTGRTPWIVLAAALLVVAASAVGRELSDPR